MELRKVNAQDAAAQWEYTAVLPALISYERPVNMPEWFVPETYFYLGDKDRLIGEFRIRHHLTEALRRGAGHIGYSIRIDERGKGYGTEGLKVAVQIGLLEYRQKTGSACKNHG